MAVASSLIVPWAGNESIACVLKPYASRLDKELSDVVTPRPLTLKTFWAPSDPCTSCLTVLHTMAGGVGPVMRICVKSRDPSSAKFALLHQECLQGNKSAVIQLKSRRELLLAPAYSYKESPGNDGSVHEPVFWVYCLANMLPVVGSELMATHRLAIVFDLDETLLQAMTPKTLQAAISKAEATKAAIPDPSSATSPSERVRLQQLLRVAEQELALLVQDRDMLASYATTNMVDVDGDTFEAVTEPAVTDSGDLVERPIIRICEHGSSSTTAIFTRIDPTQPGSHSMLVRVREGWRTLHDKLRGMMPEDAKEPNGSPKQRFEVYICTTSEREYSLEMWRLLEAEGKVPLIPRELWPGRIVNVRSSNKKNLMSVLSPGWNESGAHPEVQLAMILDDRREVWDDATQGQILHVKPYLPHRHAAVLAVGGPANELAAAEESRRQMAVCGTEAYRLRAEVYRDVDQILKPQVHHLMTQGTAEALQAVEPLSILPACRTVAALLPNNNEQPTTSAAAAQLPGAPPITRASDFRLAEEAAASSGPAAGLPVPAGVQQPPQLPLDPRRRRAAGAAAAALGASALNPGVSSATNGQLGLPGSGFPAALPPSQPLPLLPGPSAARQPPGAATTSAAGGAGGWPHPAEALLMPNGSQAAAAQAVGSGQGSAGVRPADPRARRAKRDREGDAAAPAAAAAAAAGGAGTAMASGATAAAGTAEEALPLGIAQMGLGGAAGPLQQQGQQKRQRVAAAATPQPLPLHQRPWEAEVAAIAAGLPQQVVSLGSPHDLLVALTLVHQQMRNQSPLPDLLPRINDQQSRVALAVAEAASAGPVARQHVSEAVERAHAVMMAHTELMPPVPVRTAAAAPPAPPPAAAAAAAAAAATGPAAGGSAAMVGRPAMPLPRLAVQQGRQQQQAQQPSPHTRQQQQQRGGQLTLGSGGVMLMAPSAPAHHPGGGSMPAPAAASGSFQQLPSGLGQAPFGPGPAMASANGAVGAAAGLPARSGPGRAPLHGAAFANAGASGDEHFSAAGGRNAAASGVAALGRSQAAALSAQAAEGLDSLTDLAAATAATAGAAGSCKPCVPAGKGGKPKGKPPNWGPLEVLNHLRNMNKLASQKPQESVIEVDGRGRVTRVTYSCRFREHELVGVGEAVNGPRAKRMAAARLSLALLGYNPKVATSSWYKSAQVLRAAVQHMLEEDDEEEQREQQQRQEREQQEEETDKLELELLHGLDAVTDDPPAPSQQHEQQHEQQQEQQQGRGTQAPQQQEQQQGRGKRPAQQQEQQHGPGPGAHKRARITGPAGLVPTSVTLPAMHSGDGLSNGAAPSVPWPQQPPIASHPSAAVHDHARFGGAVAGLSSAQQGGALLLGGRMPLPWQQPQQPWGGGVMPQGALRATGIPLVARSAPGTPPHARADGGATGGAGGSSAPLGQQGGQIMASMGMGSGRGFAAPQGSNVMPGLGMPVQMAMQQQWQQGQQQQGRQGSPQQASPKAWPQSHGGGQLGLKL